MDIAEVLPVEQVFDDWIVTVEEPREPDGKFHPSSLWMCDRQAVMSARGEPRTNPPSAVAKRIFKIGHDMHERIQQALSEKYGGQVESEFAIEGPHLSGHGDQLLFLDEKTGIVYEYKSTKSIAKVKRDGVPQEHHVKQAATYAVAKTRMGIKIAQVRIVYFEKNSLEIVEFAIPYRVQWEKMVDDKIAALAPYLDEKRGEYPKCTGPNWLHAYCPFFPACKETVPGAVRVRDAVEAKMQQILRTPPPNPFNW